MGPNEFYVYRHDFPNGAVYVGKGKKGRAYIPRTSNRHWVSLRAKYGPPEVSFVATGAPEELAFLCEVEYIDQLRRVGARICNHTDGGEGISGYRYTPEQLAALSARRAAYMQTPEARAKYSASTSAHMSRPETKVHMQAKLQERMQDPNYRASLSERAKLVSAHPEVRAARKAVTARLWADADKREALVQKLRDYWGRPEVRAAQSAKRKEYMSRPEVRAKYSMLRREHIAKFGPPNVNPTILEFYSTVHGTFIGTRKEFLTAWPDINASKLSAIIHARRSRVKSWVFVGEVQSE